MHNVGDETGNIDCMNVEEEEHPLDLLPAYALGLLDAAEQAQAEAHLASCEVCRSELAAFVEVADQVALAVPRTEAPAGLRQRLLDEAHRTQTAAGKATRAGWWGRIRQALGRLVRWPVWRPVMAALLLLLAASNVYLWLRVRQLESENALYQQAINLGGTEAAPEARGIILVRPDEFSGTLLVNGLPALDVNQQYQLWLVRDEERVSGAVFSVAEEGYATVPIFSPEALPSYTRFGVTIEPAGGSPGPTGAGVLRSTTGRPEDAGGE